MRALVPLVLAAGCVRAVPPPAPVRADPHATALWFDALEHAVDHAWDPAAAWHALPPATTAAIHGDRLATTIRAEVAPDGSVRSLVITRSSGVAALDDEALRALRAAGPFTAMPRGAPPSFDLTFDLDVSAALPSVTAAR